MRCLVWFRSDLRTIDQCALHHATRAASRGVVGLFVVSPGQWQSHDYSGPKVDLILRSLRCLSQELARLNIPLLIRTAPALRDVPALVASTAREYACDALHFNKEYEIDERRRDDDATAACERLGVKVHAWTDQSFLEPGDVRTQSGTFYTVFSPFQRAALAKLAEAGGVREWPLPKKQHAMVEVNPAHCVVPERIQGWSSAVSPELWPAGEVHALRQLREFAQGSVVQYKQRRDFPAIAGTSRLSPALCVGTISPRQCYAAAIQADTAHRGSSNKLGPSSPGVVHWISELMWREFYIHILVGFPRVCMHRAFQPATERIRWRSNDAHLRAWQQGMTGVPIVDAGMRQLLRDGWMHNRVRMITAMFFSKNLFLDWRLGERWFMQHLIDGFLASNNGGWQWSASTGTDAAPYFRIFNPVSQSMKFDPQGAYIHEYVPELRDLSGDELHAPWKLPSLLRSQLDYPDPIVDLSDSRRKAIEAFAAIKGPAPASIASDDD